MHSFEHEPLVMTYGADDLRRLLPEIQKGILAHKEGQIFHSRIMELGIGKSSRGVRNLLRTTTYDKVRRKLFREKSPTLDDLDQVGIFHAVEQGFIPLIDLGAIPLQKVRDQSLSLAQLQERGITEIALMEDRDPLFFLNFSDYDPKAIVPLNRHGMGNEKKAQWTMEDMKTFIDICHAHGIKVYQGFWSNLTNLDNNPFLQRNKAAGEPVVLGSDDMNPLCEVTDEAGEKMLFVEYIIRQYDKIKTAFKVDGLFLGDGFMGYRSFLRSDFIGKFGFAQKGWEIFYAMLGQAIHERGDQLMAYDVMGRTYEDACASGVDYQKILPHMDKLFVQTYGQAAWNNYMTLPDYTLGRDTMALQTLNKKLPQNLRDKLYYTAELGDSVEGWGSTKRIVQRQLDVHRDLVNGILGVWSNEVVHAALRC